MLTVTVITMASTTGTVSTLTGNWNRLCLPKMVHELKFSSTWAPSSQFAATLFARGPHGRKTITSTTNKITYVPGVTFYYAPNSKMNLTMAYTFNKQKTENQMCVGWYHG